MGFLQYIRSDELDIIRALPTDSQCGRLLSALRERVRDNTSEAALVQSGDTQEWYHLIWERFADAAFIYALDRDARLGQWLHDRTLEVCRKPLDEWVGPWFRKHADPPVGMLESAHITNAVCEVIGLSPELFNEAEIEEIITALRDKGLLLCERYINGRIGNNWYCVLLSGYTTASVMLGLHDNVERAVGLYNDCLGLYDSDGYGETLQYGNYASLALIQARNLLLTYDPSLSERLPLSPIAGMVRWQAASLMYMKPLHIKPLHMKSLHDGKARSAPTDTDSKAYPRSVNFGDCAAIFRPSGDIPLHIAADYDDTKICGLARWLFDTTYADPTLEPDELATFGFFNQFGWRSVALLAARELPDVLTPRDIDMPLCCEFATGTSVVRDSWQNPRAILAVQSGYETHKVDSHRHCDLNSFILAASGERIFVDPGHCCYRLDTWRQSCRTNHHNTWDFIDMEGNSYTQRPMRAHQPPLNRRVEYSVSDSFTILASDCAAAYGAVADGGHFKRCERVFICRLPDVIFIIDRIEADLPIKVVSHFVTNNRENQLDLHIADDYRIILRRGGAGVKFFTFGDMLMSQRWGFVHDYYHPQPNQAGQGKEGSSYIFDYTSSEFAVEHINIHVIVMSDTETIRGWHIKRRDEAIVVTSPGEREAIRLHLNPSAANWFSVE